MKFENSRRGFIRIVHRYYKITSNSIQFEKPTNKKNNKKATYLSHNQWKVGVKTTSSCLTHRAFSYELGQVLLIKGGTVSVFFTSAFSLKECF